MLLEETGSLMVVFKIFAGKPRAEGGRGKAPKDPNKPKRSVSAYFFFLADCRETAKREGRSISKVYVTVKYVTLISRSLL